MARVAMLRFWSEMRLSMSMLQLVTAMGWLMATLFNVRTAANLHTLSCHHKVITHTFSAGNGSSNAFKG